MPGDTATLSYDIERSDGTGYTHMASAQSSPFYDGGLVSGDSYSYRVRAVNDVMAGPWKRSPFVIVGQVIYSYAIQLSGTQFMLEWNTNYLRNSIGSTDVRISVVTDGWFAVSFGNSHNPSCTIGGTENGITEISSYHGSSSLSKCISFKNGYRNGDVAIVEFNTTQTLPQTFSWATCAHSTNLNEYHTSRGTYVFDNVEEDEINDDVISSGATRITFTLF